MAREYWRFQAQCLGRGRLEEDAARAALKNQKKMSFTDWLEHTGLRAKKEEGEEERALRT